jgi:hypothetical protein
MEQDEILFLFMNKINIELCCDTDHQQIPYTIPKYLTMKLEYVYKIHKKTISTIMKYIKIITVSVLNIMQ